jgi:hypothetical protein
MRAAIQPPPAAASRPPQPPSSLPGPAHPRHPPAAWIGKSCYRPVRDRYARISANCKSIKLIQSQLRLAMSEYQPNCKNASAELRRIVRTAASMDDGHGETVTRKEGMEKRSCGWKKGVAERDAHTIQDQKVRSNDAHYGAQALAKAHCAQELIQRPRGALGMGPGWARPHRGRRDKEAPPTAGRGQRNRALGAGFGTRLWRDSPHVSRCIERWVEDRFIRSIYSGAEGGRAVQEEGPYLPHPDEESRRNVTEREIQPPGCAHGGPGTGGRWGTCRRSRASAPGARREASAQAGGSVDRAQPGPALLRAWRKRPSPSESSC